MSIITIDSSAGETQLTNELELRIGRTVQIKRAPLPLGDIDIDLENGFRMLIERKSTVDLANSLTDSRYASQTQRMRDMCASNPDVKVGLLISSPLPDFDQSLHSIPGSTLYSCLTKLQLRDNFKILFAHNIEDSASVIAQLVNHALKGSFTSNPSSSSGTRLGKRPRDAAAEPLAAALATILGVSPAMASSIHAAFPTASSIIAASTAELAAIPTGKRSVGQKVAARIKDAFH